MQVNDRMTSQPSAASQAAPANRSQDFFTTFHMLPDSRMREAGSGLKIAVVSPGNGETLKAGMTVKMQYTGWLEDGTKFDSSVDKGQPFEFKMGAGRVIKGWEEGLLGMKVGERRQLVIPASMAYGDRQVGKIPSGATLVFNVEAVAVTPPAGNATGTVSVRA